MQCPSYELIYISDGLVRFTKILQDKFFALILHEMSQILNEMVLNND